MITTLKDLLIGKLSEKELATVPSAFEIIGNKEKAVAVIEISDSIKKRKRIIAQAIMEHHKNIKSVLEKISARAGIFRTRKYRLIAGDRDTAVIHKESGCLFKLDIRKTYFSPREGTERLRIADLLCKSNNITERSEAIGITDIITKSLNKENKSDLARTKKKVMVFFAGIGVFPIIIEKKTGIQTTGIEINPAAVKFFKENNKLNKTNALAVKGDVKKIYKRFKDYDNVIMPLPESSMKFIKQAVYCLKDRGICHLYCFAKADNKITKRNETKMTESLGKKSISDSAIGTTDLQYKSAKGKIPDLDSIKTNIMKDIKKIGRKCSITHIQKVLPWGPGIYKYRIDITVF